jgi:hypothetical protein
MSAHKVRVPASLILVCAVACGLRPLPTDDDLAAGLKANRGTLDELVQLCQEDAVTAIWDKGHNFEAAKTVTGDRARQYVELFEQAKLMGARRSKSGALLFQTARFGIMTGRTVGAGYAYSEMPPSPLVPKLAGQPLSSGQQSYRAIDGNWYIFYSR